MGSSAMHRLRQFRGIVSFALSIADIVADATVVKQFYDDGEEGWFLTGALIFAMEPTVRFFQALVQGAYSLQQRFTYSFLALTRLDLVRVLYMTLTASNDSGLKNAERLREGLEYSEVVLESIPQALLQTYVIAVQLTMFGQVPSQAQYVALGISLVTTARGVASHRWTVQKTSAGVVFKVLMLLFTMCEVAARILTVALFGAGYKIFVFVALGVQYLLMLFIRIFRQQCLPRLRRRCGASNEDTMIIGITPLTFLGAVYELMIIRLNESWNRSAIADVFTFLVLLFVQLVFVGLPFALEALPPQLPFGVSLAADANATEGVQLFSASFVELIRPPLNRTDYAAGTCWQSLGWWEWGACPVNGTAAELGLAFDPSSLPAPAFPPILLAVSILLMLCELALFIVVESMLVCVYDRRVRRMEDAAAKVVEDMKREEEEAKARARAASPKIATDVTTQGGVETTVQMRAVERGAVSRPAGNSPPRETMSGAAETGPRVGVTVALGAMVGSGSGALGQRDAAMTSTVPFGASFTAGRALPPPIVFNAAGGSSGGGSGAVGAGTPRNKNAASGAGGGFGAATGVVNSARSDVTIV